MLISSRDFKNNTGNEKIKLSSKLQEFENLNREQDLFEILESAERESQLKKSKVKEKIKFF